MTCQPSMSSSDCHPEHLAVEVGERARVRAVDHSLFEGADHSRKPGMRLAASGSPIRFAAMSMAKLRSPVVASSKSPPLGLIISCSGRFLLVLGPGACGSSRRL